MARASRALCVLHAAKKAPKAAPGLQVCKQCLEHIRYAIGQLPRQYDELERALQPGGLVEDLHISGTFERALPIATIVADERDAIRSGLRGWCAFLLRRRRGEKDRQMASPRTQEPKDIGPWIAPHTDWLLADLDAARSFGKFCDDRFSRAKGLLNPTGARRVTVGYCTQFVDDQMCGGDMVAICRRVDDLLPSKMHCRRCGYGLYPSEWLRWSRTQHTARSALPPIPSSE